MGFSVLLEPQNRAVANKLGVATGLMCTLPIAAFYLGLYLFPNNDSNYYAGGMAILVTNLIVAGYVVMAFREDDDNDDDKEEEYEKNDASGPRVGAFKRRVD